MLRPFPFFGTYGQDMGLSLVPAEGAVCESTENYPLEVALKRELLDTSPSYYFHSLPHTWVAQWEVLELVLTQLSRRYPDFFVLVKEGKQVQWQNKLLDKSHHFGIGDTESLPLAPLDWVGRQVQEDLLLLNEDSMLVAGQLCFPSGWSLDEKMGAHFLELHAPLPQNLSAMIQHANRFMKNIPVGKSFQRDNWGLRLNDQLDLSTRHSEQYQQVIETLLPGLTSKTLFENLFLRMEYQTFTRLPISNYVLFTVHTYLQALNEVLDTQEKAHAMCLYMKTVPEDVLKYKLIWPFYDKLMEGLEKRSS